MPCPLYHRIQMMRSFLIRFQISSKPSRSETFFADVMPANKTGIAKTVLGTTEHLLVLYPTKECIIAKLLHYQEEIQELPKSYSKIEVSRQELEMAKILIESMTRKFDVSSYHDEYQERLRSAITTKINGNEIVSSDTETVPNNVINLMEALQRSVELVKKSRMGTA